MKRINKLNKKLTKIAVGILTVLMLSVAVSSPAHTWTSWVRVVGSVQIAATNQFRQANGEFRSRVLGAAVGNTVEAQVRGTNACNGAIANGIRRNVNRSLAHQVSTFRPHGGNTVGWGFRDRC